MPSAVDIRLYPVTVRPAQAARVADALAQVQRAHALMQELVTLLTAGEDVPREAVLQEIDAEAGRLVFAWPEERSDAG